MVPASIQSDTQAPDKGGRPKGPPKCELCRRRTRACGPGCKGWAAVQPAASAATPPPLPAAAAPQADSVATAAVDSAEQPHRSSERRRSVPGASRDEEPATSLRQRCPRVAKRRRGLFSEPDAGEEEEGGEEEQESGEEEVAEEGDEEEGREEEGGEEEGESAGDLAILRARLCKGALREEADDDEVDMKAAQLRGILRCLPDGLHDSDDKVVHY